MSASLRRDSVHWSSPSGELWKVIHDCQRPELLFGALRCFRGFNVSTYDVEDLADEEHWLGYVRTNNALAEDFLRNNPVSSTDECILTNASGQEFRQIKRQAKATREPTTR